MNEFLIATAAAVAAGVILAGLTWLISETSGIGDWLKSRPWAIAGLVGFAVALVTAAVMTPAFNKALATSGPPGPAGPEGRQGPPGVAGNSVPPGAVVAFDQDDCPLGWTAFKFAEGRMVIGVSSDYPLRDSRGKKEFVLKEDNIPEHRHDTMLGVGNNQDYQQWGLGEYKQQVIYGAGVGSLKTALTSPVGRLHPDAVPTMPPYIALTYCKKG